MSTSKKRNYYIDTLKCIACFLVVMLHMPAQAFSDDIYTIQVSLGRCGVPIFFMLSGYMMGIKSINNNSRVADRKLFIRQALKIIKYFIFFELLDAFLNYGLNILKNTETAFTINTHAIIKLLIFNVPVMNGILWYLLAYAYCLFIYYLISYLKKGYQILVYLTPILLIGYFTFGRYSLIILHSKFEHYYSNNFLFAAIPMFTLGFIMPKINWKWLTTPNNKIILAVSILLMISENLAFDRSKQLNSGRNDYLFNIITAFLLVYYVTHINCTENKQPNILATIGCKYSLYIYVFQGVANRLWRVFLFWGGKSPKGNLIRDFFSISKPITVFITALLLSLLYCLIRNSIMKIIRPKQV